MQKLELLAKELDSDKWQQVVIPKTYELIVEYLHNPGLKTIRELPKEEFSTQCERLVSDETPYWVVNSILVLLQIIYDYMRMISNLPSISYECSNKLLEIVKVSSYIKNI